MHNYQYSYPGVGDEEQFGIRFSCEKTGCNPVHSNDGRVMICRDSYSAAEFAREGIGGHGVKLVRRVVTYPEWEVADDPDDEG
jgi:hypothetical protein